MCISLLLNQFVSTSLNYHVINISPSLLVCVTYVIVDNVTDDVIVARNDDVTPSPDDDVSRWVSAAGTANSERTM